MRKILPVLGVIILLLTSIESPAQTGMPDEPVQMADAFRANGKIYVVVAVVAAMITGLLAYLIYLDRKISRLEKQG